MNVNANRKLTNITILAFSNIAIDARVLRQIKFLSVDFHVSVIGFGNMPNMHNVKMFQINAHILPVSLSPLKKIRHRLRNGLIKRYIQLILGRLYSTKAYETWYWSHSEYQQAYQAILASHPTFIHANDWNSLPVAVLAGKQINAQVVADLHEYAPLEHDGIIWQLFLRPLREYILKRYIPETVATITVNQTIADKYRQLFHFSPIVIMNAPIINPDIVFRSTKPDCIHLIHHGGLVKGRNPELMIKTAALLNERFHVNFMLVGNQAEIDRLNNLANAIAPGKISFYPPVSPEHVIQEISKFDIGFYLLPNSNFNNSVASPNKFFDFIHAGLAICIGPSPEMARMAREFGFGIISNSFSPKVVAKMINQLHTYEIDQKKQAAIKARYTLNAEAELLKLVNLYQKLSCEKI